MSNKEKNDLKRNKGLLSGELYGTEVMYKTLFNNTPDIISLILFEDNRPTNFIDVNKTCIERMGYTPEEFSKLTVEDVMNPDALSDIQDKVTELLKDGKSYFESVLITKNGEEIPVETSNSLFEMDGKDVVLSISRDLSERKSAEKALKEMEKIYHLISENTSDVIWIQDIQSHSLTYVSPSIYNLVGYSAEEILNKSLKTFMDPEAFQFVVKRTLERINALESGDESARVQTDLMDVRKKDGSKVPTEVVTTLLAENGKVTRVLGVTRDISERKKVEDALRESEEFNRSIVTASPDCIKVLDLDGNLLMMSEGGQRIMEVDDVSCILNTSLIDFYAEQFQPAARNAIKTAREGSTARFTAYCPTLKGTPKWWDIIVTPILDANGKPEKLSAVSRDITQRKLDEEKLRWNEDRLMMGMDMADMVYWEYETEKDLFTFDDQFYALYGTSAEEEGGNMISGQEYIERFVDPSGYEIMDKEFAKTFEADDPDFISTPQHWMIRADGERRFLQVRFKIMFDEMGNKIGTRGVNQDITELKIAEDKLKLNQDLLLMSMDMANLVKWEYDIKTDRFTFDDHFYALYGTNAQEQGGYEMTSVEYINLFVPAEEKEFVEKESAKILEIDDHDIISTIQHWIVRGDGQRRFISLRVKPIYDENNKKIGNRGVTQDITELKKTEEKLRQLLEDKDMLIKEIHHRVKNNLMIISSLLNLQSNYLKDRESIEIFRESQNRAKSMALIHERLYQSEDLKSIGFKEYITTLANDLYRNYVEDPGRVELQLDIQDLDVDIDHAIPLGLILNELITNSMKYGFPGDKEGKVFVKFSKEGDEYVLRAGDDGIGFPRDVDFKNTNTLGMQLVNGLSQQVDGDLELNTDNGTEFSIRFKEKKIG